MDTKKMRAKLVHEGYHLARLNKLKDSEIEVLYKAVFDKILGLNCRLCGGCKMPYIKKFAQWNCMQVDCIHPCPCKKKRR